MKYFSDVVAFIVVVLFLVLAIIFTPINESGNNRFGFVTHSLYPGYAIPISSINVDTTLIFNNVTDATSRLFEVSDDIIYRRGYISYDGQSWTPFNITPDSTVNGEWISSGGLVNVAFTSYKLNLSTTKNVSNNTYIIIYSCSKDTTIHDWNCHDGWQIIKFDARLNTVSPISSSPVITFISPTPTNGATITTSNVQIVATISDDSNTISSWIDFDKSLIGYWSMDYYTSTGISDNSTYKRTGTFQGGLGGSNIVTGIRGRGLSFDGVDDSLNMGTADLGITSQLTASAWVNSKVNNNGRIISKHGYSPDHGWMISRFADTQSIEFKISTDSINWLGGETSSNSFLTNTWYHIAATYDGNTMRVYINGIENTGGNFPASVTGNINVAPLPLLIGETVDDYYFNGIMDEVMLFNRALSASEVKALYDSKINKFDTTLSDLANGQHAYTVYAIDNEGNFASTAQRILNVNAPITCNCPSDNNVCTNDVCSNNVCQHTPTSGCCIADYDCGTNQICSNNVCVDNVVLPVCNDGRCTGTETCSICPEDCGSCSTNYLRTFYVSSSTGSTSGDGSINNPWKTLSQVNAQTFRAGDAVLFKRGDSWYGSLTVGQSGSSSYPITYGAYGSGEKPILTGFTTITGWTNEGNGIYSKTISTESMLNIVLVDNINTPMGRWPDTGWLIVDSHNGQASITDSELSNSPYDWDGAELVLRPYWWVTDRNQITSHSGNTIYYTSASSYNAMDGNGYFIQNHKGTLNKIGDWAYDGSKLYMFFGTNDNPNNHVVKIPTLDDFAYVHFKNYIKFDNLHITGYNDFAINAHDSSYMTVTNCVIDFIGDMGFKSQGWETSDHTIIEHNVFDTINNDGIHFNGNSVYETIQYNTISNIGTISGLSGSGDGSGIGIEATGDNSLINYNTIKNIGYNGITFGGINTVVSNNIVDTFCMNKDDGAGIYTYENGGLGKKVINNIVMNGVGAAEGTRLPDEFRANGIYIDGSDNIFISGNSIAHNYGAGIFLNTQALNINIQDNTVFDNAEYGIQIISNMGGGGSINGMNMQNNIFFAKESGQEVLHFVTTLGDSDVRGIGNLNNNYYTRPINENEVFRTQINAWGGPTTLRNLAGWQSYSGLDPNSKKTPVTVSSSNDILFYYNELDSNKNIVLPSGNYVDVKNQAYSGTITLSPWTSVVLIKK